VQIADLPACPGDQRLLRLVWMNLITNAFKFTQFKDAARIEIGARPDQRELEIVYFVKDNGVGFDMTYKHKLFGVFERLHSKEHFEGTGVGLAIAQRIIQRHGGRIWAEGTIDQGAVFYIALPKYQPDDEMRARPLSVGLPAR
jgi:light-regulated signal transduction histidine kinase (bacteriophytochrome)